ncbi:MAG TPA: helix-turn-helix domain-containing protein, partial [Caldilineaceae bacterium]|nr:helix-turn-helix domain-containing protein [Caldilineaceae bacterium]
MAKRGAAGVVTFGALLRQLRRRAGLTQGELAVLVGFSVAQISRLEKDERLPDPQMVMEQFLPALVLEEEPRLAQQLVTLAAGARGERPPTLLVTQQRVQTSIREEILPSAEIEGHLPGLPLPLVGRERDIDTICKRLMAAPGRLLTLLGPPGVGKTQLALACAAQVQHLFAD